MKSEPEIYYYPIRVNNNNWTEWGNFVIGSNGFFAAFTDYANGVFQWYDWGKEDFRQFVVDMVKNNDRDYFLGKLFPSTQYEKFDPEATIKRIKEYILYHFRERDYTKDEARAELNDLRDYFEYEQSLYGFHQWLNETEITEAYELACYRYPSDVTMFWDVLMKPLAEEIQKDLDAVLFVDL